MSRRPYIHSTPQLIKDELVPYGSHNKGYSQSALNKEPVGMTRGDWFRGECRNCGQTHITTRSEDSTRYYECQNCGKLHYISSGFFGQPDRPHGRETVPLKQDECNGILCRAYLDWTNSDYVDPSWHYGHLDDLLDKLDGNYTLVDTWVEVLFSTRDEMVDPDADSLEIVGEVESADIARYIEEEIHG